ncbi:TPA: hypothetical protein NQF56_000409 [Klebsiella variicola]|nr:hypothetical protein [Klebsiella variicola]
MAATPDPAWVVRWGNTPVCIAIHVGLISEAPSGMGLIIHPAARDTPGQFYA